MSGAFTVVSATGISTVNGSDKMFNMYPNPAATAVNLQFMNTNLPATVVLIDMNGRELMNNKYNTSEVVADLKNIPNGTYFIQATQGAKIYKQQLVIAH
jgi:hypothetical protein